MSVAEGEAQTVSVEIYSDGSVRTEDDTLPYETLDFSIEVTRYLSVEYYEETYGDTYQISNDTAVEFELLLNDYTGSQTITPNSLFKFTLETESGDTISGYRLTDAEINGQSDFTVTTNIPTMLYKRFEYDSTVGEAKYLVVTTYVGGVPTTYKFELGESISPTPEPTVEITYSTLNKGETSDDIKTMQTRLIELGYLEESNDTGYYGDLTAAAVSEAQAAFGLEETGIADNEFLQLLYADDDAEEAEATVTATAATSTSD